MQYKSVHGFERGIIRDIMKNTRPDDSNPCHPVVSEPPPLSEIVSDAKNGNWDRVKLGLGKLRIATNYQGLTYISDFLDSGFADLLLDLVKKPNLSLLALAVIVNLSKLNPVESSKFFEPLCMKGLFDVILSIFSDRVSPEIETNLLIVLMNIVLLGPQFRDKVMEVFDFERICKLGDVKPKYIILFFRNLLWHPLKEEQCHVFPEPLKFLWVHFVKTDIELVLELFCVATTQEPLLLFLSRELELVRMITDMLWCHSDFVLKHALFLCIQFLKNGGDCFDVVTEKSIGRVIEIIGSANTEVAEGAARMIDYILKHERSLVPEEKYPDIARRSSVHLKKAEMGRKKSFLSCILRVLHSIPNDMVESVIDPGFADDLRDFLGVFGNNMCCRILVFVLDWINTKNDSFGMKMFQTILSDGGSDELEEMVMSADVRLSDTAKAFLQKAKEIAQ